MKDIFLKGALAGTSETANQSGWMNGDTFILFLKHFIKYVKRNVDNMVLLLMEVMLLSHP